MGTVLRASRAALVGGALLLGSVGALLMGQGVSGAQLACTFTWIGPGGTLAAPTSGVWDADPAKWSPNGVPTDSSNVCINRPTTYTVTRTTPASIRALTVGAGSGVQTLTLDATAGAVSLNLSAASINAANGRILLNGGAGSNDVQLNTGGFELTNAGGITMGGGRPFLSGVFVNAVGASVTVNPSTDFATDSGAFTFTNRGTLSIANGARLLVNDGGSNTLTSESGTIATTGTGQLRFENGSIFRAAGGTLTGNPVVLANATLTYAGTGLASGQIRFRGCCSNYLESNVPAGQGFTLDSVEAAALGSRTSVRISADRTNAGTITLDTSGGDASAHLAIDAGLTLTNTGTITSTGANGALFEGRIVNETTGVINAGTTAPAATGTGCQIVNCTHELVNRGDVNVAAGSILALNACCTTTVSNEVGGDFTLAAGAQMLHSGGTFTNRGTISLGTGAQFVSSGTLDNRATISIADTARLLQSGGTLTNDPTGTFATSGTGSVRAEGSATFNAAGALGTNPVILAGATLVYTGTGPTSGSIRFRGGCCSNVLASNVPAGQGFTLDTVEVATLGETGVLVSGDRTNAGTIIVDSSAGAAAANLAMDATLTNTGTITFTGPNGSYFAGRLVNETTGVLTVPGSVTAGTRCYFTCTHELVNRGDVNVGAGSVLTLNCCTTTVSNEVGGDFTLAAGAQMLHSGGTFTNRGTISLGTGAQFVSSGTLDNRGTISIADTARLLQSTGTLTNDPTGTFATTGTGSVRVQDGATFNAAGALGTNPVILAGATLVYTGTGPTSGSIRFRGGCCYSNFLGSDVPAGQSLTLDTVEAATLGSTVVRVSADRTNAGTITLDTSGGAAGVYLVIDAGVTLTTTGTMAFTGPNSIQFEGRIVNETTGVINVGTTAPATTGTICGFLNCTHELVNRGDVNVAAGAILAMNASSTNTVTNESGGAITVADAGVFRVGSGTFTNQSGATIATTGTGQVRVEGGASFVAAGTVTGNPVVIAGGTLSGLGLSSGSIVFRGSGNLLASDVPSGQTVLLDTVEAPTLGSTAVTIDANRTNAGTIVLAGGAGSDVVQLGLVAGFTLTNTGTMTIGGGAPTIDGRYVNASGGTINVNASTVPLRAHTLDLVNAGAFNVNAGATFETSHGFSCCGLVNTVTNQTGGTISVADGGVLRTTSTSCGCGNTTILTNQAGATIATTGTGQVRIDGGSSFNAAGAVTGNPVVIAGGTLSGIGLTSGSVVFRGSGNLLAADVPAGQTVLLDNVEVSTLGATTVRIDANRTNAGSIMMNGGPGGDAVTLSVDPGFTLTNTGTMTAGGGEPRLEGRFVNASGATMTFNPSTSSARLYGSTEILNAGTLAVTAGATFETLNAVCCNFANVLTNQAGGMITVADGGILRAVAGGCCPNTTTFTNEAGATIATTGTGQVRVEGGASFVAAGTVTGNPVVIAGGTLSGIGLTSGSIVFRGAGNLLAANVPAGQTVLLDNVEVSTLGATSVRIDADRTNAGSIMLNGGAGADTVTLTVDPGFTLTSTGTVTAGGGEPRLEGRFVNASGATMTFNPSTSPARLFGSTEVLNAGTLAVATGATLETVNFFCCSLATVLTNQAGGTVNVATGGLLRIGTSGCGCGNTTTFTNEAGATIATTGTGQVRVENGSTFSAAGAVTGSPVIVAGARLVYTGTGLTSGSVVFRGGGANTLGSDVPAGQLITLDVVEAPTIGSTNVSVDGSWTNNGTIVLNGGTGTDYLSLNVVGGFVLTNAGTITIGGGNPALTGDFLNVSTGTITVNTTTGGGANLTNQGTLDVAAGAELQLSSYTQPGSVFRTHIVSLSSYGRLNVSGTATLGGTLEIVTEGGFRPFELDSFQVIFAGGGVSGTFSTVVGQMIGQGGNYEVAYNPSDVTLVFHQLPGIGGVVTEEGTGIPIAGVCVKAYQFGDDTLVASGVTDANGGYILEIATGGSYRVRFVDCGDTNHFEEYFDNKTTYADADIVSIPSGTFLPDISVALTRGGAIVGVVLDAVTSAPIAGRICAYAYGPTGALVSSGLTDPATGAYLIPRLLTGSHKVNFADCNGTGHIGEWFNDRPDYASATAVPVTLGSDTTGINASLAPSTASIAGRVTDSVTAAPIAAGVCVYAYDAGGTLVRSVLTDGSGNYTLANLAPGNHKLNFADCMGTDHLSEWYNDKLNYPTADPVMVSAGVATTGIDAALAPSTAAISGRVSDASTSAAIVGACVYAYDAGGTLVRSALTDGSGNYTLPNLAPGPHKLFFADCGSTGHVNEWYNDKANYGVADAVTVTAGATTAGIDAGLAGVPAGGISGQVTDASSTSPVAGVCVYAYDAAGSLVRSATTDASGNYTMTNMGAGAYKVLFYGPCAPGGLISEWFNDKPSYGLADTVDVVNGTITAGTNAALARPGAISGTVRTEASSAVLPGVCVYAYDSLDRLAASDVTDGAGAYSLEGLSAGSYKLFFEGGCATPQHRREFYNDQPTYAGAAPVAAGATGIDAVLTPV